MPICLLIVKFFEYKPPDKAISEKRKEQSAGFFEARPEEEV